MNSIAIAWVALGNAPNWRLVASGLVHHPRMVRHVNQIQSLRVECLNAVVPSFRIGVAPAAIQQEPTNAAY